MYAVGNQGINVSEDLAVDFRVISSQGSRRILELAFDHAERTGKKKVTVVTKANVVKTNPIFANRVLLENILMFNSSIDCYNS